MILNFAHTYHYLVNSNGILNKIGYCKKEDDENALFISLGEEEKIVSRRNEESIIFLKSQQISAKHCSLSKRGVIDYSTNGTFINLKNYEGFASYN